MEKCIIFNRRLACRRHAGHTITAAAILAVCIASHAYAAEVHVPADQPTIQAAINAANPGDTVLVAPGTYTETINIAKPLALLSTGGPGVTTIQRNVNDVPVVVVNAPDVTIGAPGQGFTIHQQDPGPAGTPHAGNAVIHIVGSAVGHGSVTVADNILRGNAIDEGIVINPILEGGRLVVRNNTFQKADAAAFGFKDAIHFHHAQYGDPINDFLSLNAAEVEITGNIINDFQAAAIYFHGDVYNSSVLISGGSMRAIGAATSYGLHFEQSVRTFSHVALSDVTIQEVDYGVWVDDSIEHQSELTVQHVSLPDFTSSGLYVDDDVTNRSILRVQSCTFAGSATAREGIYLSGGVYSASLLDCSSNTISDVRDYGIGFYNEASEAYITANTIHVTGASSDGVYLDTEYGGYSEVRANTIRFGYEGIYESYPYAGSIVIIDGNTLTAADSGASYGIEVNDIEYGSAAFITNNTVSGFTDYGFYSSGTEDGSELVITGNRFAAHATDGSEHGIYPYDVEGGSHILIAQNDVSGFTEDGLYIDSVEEASSLTAADNKFTAYPTGSEYGVYAYEVEYGAVLTLARNQVTGFGNQQSTTYGLYNYDLEYGATLVMTDNIFTAHSASADFGVWLDDGPEDGCELVFTGNTVSGFTDTGFHTYYGGYYGCVATITGNTFSAAPDGAENGLYIDEGFDYGSSGVIADNTINGFTDEGIFLEYVADGSELVIRNNTLTAIDGSAVPQVGIHLYYDVNYGSALRILANRIIGINDKGAGGYALRAGYPDVGSELEVSDNVATALPNGFTFGAFFDYFPSDGSSLKIERNQFSGFSLANVRFEDDYYPAGEFVCAGNVFIGGVYGVHFGSLLDIKDSEVSFTRNTFRDFTTAAIVFGRKTYGSRVTIDENKFLGAAAPLGVQFNNDIGGGSEISMQHNCFQGVETAVDVGEIRDTAALAAHLNDFAGSLYGIFYDGDAAHTVEAQDNWWGSDAGPDVTGNAKSFGPLNAAPFAAAPPDADGDGVSNCADTCFDTPEGQPANAEGCSCLQLNPEGDADGDGVLDCEDGCPNDPLKQNPGACGCGAPELDSDGDGTADCIDGCPGDARKTDPGACGCGTIDEDSDGDGVPDCYDNCPATSNPGQEDADADGIGDACLEDRDPDQDPNRPTPRPGEDGPIPGDGSDGDDGPPFDGGGDPSTGLCGIGLCGAGFTGSMPLMLAGLAMMRRRVGRALGRRGSR